LIFRWYKILSPKIVVDVKSVTFDQRHQTLYVSMSQIFSFFFLPFYKPDVSLVTVLQLFHEPDTNKFYIQKQEDLYQLNEFVKFVLPGGATFFYLWQWFATLLCAVGAIVLSPVTWLAEGAAEKKKTQ